MYLVLLVYFFILYLVFWKKKGVINLLFIYRFLEQILFFIRKFHQQIIWICDKEEAFFE
jgi:hypothetical protein